MTSSRNLSRSARSARRGKFLRRFAVFSGALAAFAVVLVGWFSLASNRVDPSGAQAASARSTALLKASNPTGARDEALSAVRNDPSNAEAHLALARAMLALGDGIAADAELLRAIDGGVRPGSVAHLRARAILLQGDGQKALTEADKTDPQFLTEKLRVRAQAMAQLGNLAGAVRSFEMALARSPKDAALWTDVGRFKFDVGDQLGAIQASQRAVDLAPGSLDALLLRGRVVRSQYGLVASLPWFEAALKRDANNHDVLIEYAATLGDVGRSVDSLAAARRAEAARPNSAQALYLQAVIAARGANYSLARTLLDRAGPEVAALPAALLLGGALDLQAGENEQARERLAALVGQQPMNIAARKLMASALLRGDAAKNAIDVLRPVVARGDADSYALALVGRGFERIGDRANSARFLDRAAYPASGEAGFFSADQSATVASAQADERAGDPTAAIPLIRALLDKGDPAGALAQAQSIAGRNIGAPAAHTLVGDVLMLVNRPADAVTAYRRAADLRFDEPIMLRLVEAQEKVGDRKAAANTLALFASQNPVNIAALRLSANWQLAAGDYAAAVDTLELLRSRLDDGDAAVNAALASAYTGLGDTDDAVEFGEAAYALAPANPAVADAFGWALYRNGDTAGGMELLQKAVVMAPRHPGLRWHLAQIYAEMNRKAEAKTQAQAALASPSFTEREAATALVARMG